jgi:hypothetical protein
MRPFASTALASIAASLLAACFSFELSEADWQRIEAGIVDASTDAGIPIVVWGQTMSSLDDHEVGPIDFSLTYTNTDRDRALSGVTFVVAAANRSGDPVPAADGDTDVTRLRTPERVEPGATTTAEWDGVWRKDQPFWFAHVDHVEVLRVELEYVNGDRASYDPADAEQMYAALGDLAADF